MKALSSGAKTVAIRAGSSRTETRPVASIAFLRKVKSLLSFTIA